MTGTFIQGTKVENVSGASVPVSYISDNTLGNQLVLGIFGDHSLTNFSVVDTRTNIWLPLATITDTQNSQFMSLWWVSSCAAGANTVTVSGLSIGGGLGTWLYPLEYSGLGFVDQVIQTQYISSIANAGITNAPAVSLRNANDTVVTFTYSNTGNVFSGGCTINSIIPTERQNSSNALSIADLSIASAGQILAQENTARAAEAQYFIVAAFTSSNLPVPAIPPNTINSPLFGLSGIRQAVANPQSLDIMQVVNEGGKVVWNMDQFGNVNINPSNPTSTALSRYFGSSFAQAFNSNLYNLDVLQVIGRGGVTSFRLDYNGFAGSPN